MTYPNPCRCRDCEAVYVECPDCSGSGDALAVIGGNPYPVKCPTCSGKGGWYADPKHLQKMSDER
jgi:hypothetical protein